MIDKTLALQHFARMRVVAETINDPRSDILFQILLFMVVEQVFQCPQIDDMRGRAAGHTDLIHKGVPAQVIGRTDIGQAFRIGNFITDDMVVGREVIAFLSHFVYAAQVLGERSFAQPAGRGGRDIKGDVQRPGQVVRPVLDHVKARSQLIIILSWHRLSG